MQTQLARPSQEISASSKPTDESALSAEIVVRTLSQFRSRFLKRATALGKRTDLSTCLVLSQSACFEKGLANCATPITSQKFVQVAQEQSLTPKVIATIAKMSGNGPFIRGVILALAAYTYEPEKTQVELNSWLKNHPIIALLGEAKGSRP